MGLALMGSMLLLPLSDAVHAAPAIGNARGTTNKTTAAAIGGSDQAILVSVTNPNGQGQISVALPLDAIASIEGVSTVTLQQDLAAGLTLLQIAGSKYTSAQALATALLANVQAKLSRAPADSMPNATQLYAALLSAMETIVVTPHPQITSMAVKVADGKRGALFALDQVASVLGVSTTTLQQDLAAGQTLLQIAGSKYGSAQALATALLAPIKSKLDRAVADGKLTPAQESLQYTPLLNQAEILVVTPHPRLASPEAGTAGGDALGSPASVKALLIPIVATSCNTTPDALGAAVQAGGKSVLQICQATNPAATLDSLSTAITNAARSRLDAAVAAGAITTSQESKVLAALQANLPTWLTKPIPQDAGAQNS
jgi:hypothetical protein